MKIEKMNAWVIVCTVLVISLIGCINIFWQVQIGNVSQSTLIWHSIYLLLGWIFFIIITWKINIDESIDKLGIKIAWIFWGCSILIMIIRWLVPSETYSNYRIGFSEMHMGTWLAVIILYIISLKIIINKCQKKACTYIFVYEVSICLLLHILIRFRIAVVVCMLITAVSLLKTSNSGARLKKLGGGSLCAAIVYFGSVVIWNYNNPLYDQNFNIYLWMEALKMDVDIDGALKALSLSDDALSLLFTQSWWLGIISMTVFVLLVVFLLMRIFFVELIDKTNSMSVMICVLLVFIIMCNLLKNTVVFFNEPVPMPFFSASQIDNTIYLFLLGVGVAHSFQINKKSF